MSGTQRRGRPEGEEQRGGGNRASARPSNASGPATTGRDGRRPEHEDRRSHNHRPPRPAPRDVDADDESQRRGSARNGGGGRPGRLGGHRGAPTGPAAAASAGATGAATRGRNADGKAVQSHDAGSTTGAGATNAASKIIIHYKTNLSTGSMWAKGGSCPTFADMVRQRNDSKSGTPQPASQSQQQQQQRPPSSRKTPDAKREESHRQTPAAQPTTNNADSSNNKNSTDTESNETPAANRSNKTVESVSRPARETTVTSAAPAATAVAAAAPPRPVGQRIAVEDRPIAQDDEDAELILPPKPTSMPPVVTQPEPTPMLKYYILEIDRVDAVKLPLSVVQTASVHKGLYNFSSVPGKPPAPQVLTPAPPPTQTLYRPEAAAGLGARPWAVGPAPTSAVTANSAAAAVVAESRMPTHWQQTMNTSADYWSNSALADRSTAQRFAHAQLQYNSYAPPTQVQQQQQQQQQQVRPPSFFPARLRTGDMGDLGLRPQTAMTFNRNAQGGGVW